MILRVLLQLYFIHTLQTRLSTQVSSNVLDTFYSNVFNTSIWIDLYIYSLQQDLVFYKKKILESQGILYVHVKLFLNKYLKTN